MDKKYYEVTSELDAREILRYLNNLGIHNISGEVLKYFITDLKKLIKLDLQQKKLHNIDKYDVEGPERLHSASTFSSRIKSKEYEHVTLTCSRECHKSKRILKVRDVHSAPTLGNLKVEVEKPLRRACSCVRVDKKPELVRERSTTVSSNEVTLEQTGVHQNNEQKHYPVIITPNDNFVIKVPKKPVKKKCDPVSLYHYYTSLWQKYKSNVPGENDWSDLRWSIRQKMAGNISKEIIGKVPESQRDKEQNRVKS